MSTLAWHFVGPTLRNGDPIPPDGETLVYDGKVSMCVSGLHASKRLIDALEYAPGYTLCRVRCSSIRQTDEEKLVCKRRKILWRIDAEEALRAFARHEALSVAHLWNPPAVVLDYLMTGKKELRAAATDTAKAIVCSRAIAWGTNVSAALAAVRALQASSLATAAWTAAFDAAWATACNAASDSAWSTTKAAARDAVLGAASKTLEAIVKDARNGIEHWEWYL